MLVGKRQLRLRRHDIVIEEGGVVHSRYRINLKRRHGPIINDDALRKVTLRPLEKDRSVLVLQLVGESLWRHHGRSQLLREGELLLTNRNSGLSCRLTGPTETLLIEWDPGLLGTRLAQGIADALLPPGALRRIRALVRALSREDCGPEEGSEALARLLGLLREEGLPFDPIDADSLVEPVPEPFSALMRAIDKALSLTEEMPAIVDLESQLGWTRNQIHSVLCRFQKHYAFHAVGGWRALRQSWLLPSAATLMSVPGMTTEEAAALLGYATPRALCQAFANAGMPSPGNIRHALEQL